jgi:hypothetical protein
MFKTKRLGINKKYEHTEFFLIIIQFLIFIINMKFKIKSERRELNLDPINK